jgi:zinc protease
MRVSGLPHRLFGAALTATVAAAVAAAASPRPAAAAAGADAQASATAQVPGASPPAAPAPAAVAAPKPIDFTEETLDNGLRVIYAPLKSAPVVHVRVHYHVGSRDERPDRQGFAHMFEHMMFRGSAHVGNQEHMRLVNGVGGISNAFTSFDQTVYHQSVPAQHLEMVLYLEADRMASFKVDEEMYKTERKVVGEEWRIRQNRPYGTVYEELLKTAFTKHSYRWTPIGDMQHLAAAGVQDLQDFFNTYYLPNNAVLVISGDFDMEKTKAWVKKYYGWIPKGPEVKRLSPQEPPQTEARRVTVAQRVPLPMVAAAFHVPAYASDDHYALDLLGTILGSGRSSRLDRLLVNTDQPQAVDASASDMQLQDSGMFMADATVMQGKDADAVEKALMAALAEVVEKGVSAEELEKAKQQARVGLIRGRQTAENLASQLGSEELFAGDASRVNSSLAKLEAVTPEAVQAVAKKYLSPNQATILRVNPDPTGKAARAAATQAAAAMAAATAPSASAEKAAKGEAPEPVKPRQVTFPADWPAKPVVNQQVVRASFQKGTETTVDGVKVIVMPDSRLPLVNWSLTTRFGSHSDPSGKEGLADLTADLLRRGAGGMTFAQINQELESKGVTVEVSAAGDYARLGGSSLSRDLEYAMGVGRKILREPTFPADEFAKLKEQTANALALKQASPASVAEDEIEAALYGKSALGVSPTPKSVAAITLDDAKEWYKTYVHGQDAILLIAGDVTVEKGQALAKQLLAGWDAGSAKKPNNYEYPQTPTRRKIVLVDHPDAKGSVVRMGIKAYDIRSDDKYAGTIAGQILTSGIDSRLNRVVRAQKGLSYGVHGVFQPNRHGGGFMAGTDGAIDTSAEAISAIFAVLEDMRTADVTDKELNEAKTRTIGLMLMGMQTIQQQASYRVDAILNGYPIDYYDVYPEKVSAVTAEKVRELMKKYVDTARFDVVVVAPAEKVKAELEKLGDVQVVPMPAKRDGGKEPGDLLKPDGK